MTSPAKLGEIVTFMAVAKAGSFVGGGRSIGVTGSAASKAVARLEERLGTRLLNRNSRSVSLTPEGQSFFQGGERILEAVDQAETSVAGTDGTPSGLLRLTVPDAFGRGTLMPLVHDFLATWPTLRIDITFTDRVADIVEEGFDLAIRIGADTAPAGLISRVIADYPGLLCAAPSYLEDRGMPTDGEALSRHDCILFRSGTQTQDWWATAADGSVEKLPVRGRLRMDSGHAIRDAVVAGVGIAFLPSFLIEEDLRQGRLTRVLPALQLGRVRIVALYPGKRLLEPRVRHFVDFLAAGLRRAPVSDRTDR